MPSVGSTVRAAPRRALLIFVDGLGLGARDPAVNPVYGRACPRLRRWLDRHAAPVDATLDTPGLPQSATGQATLYTGRNAAVFLGRHVPGLPGPRLREFVARHTAASGRRSRQCWRGWTRFSRRSRLGRGPGAACCC